MAYCNSCKKHVEGHQYSAPINVVRTVTYRRGKCETCNSTVLEYPASKARKLAKGLRDAILKEKYKQINDEEAKAGIDLLGRVKHLKKKVIKPSNFEEYNRLRKGNKDKEVVVNNNKKVIKPSNFEEYNRLRRAKKEMEKPKPEVIEITDSSSDDDRKKKKTKGDSDDEEDFDQTSEEDSLSPSQYLPKKFLKQQKSKPQNRVNQIMEELRENPDLSPKGRSKLQKELDQLKPPKRRKKTPKTSYQKSRRLRY